MFERLRVEELMLGGKVDALSEQDLQALSTDASSHKYVLVGDMLSEDNWLPEEGTLFFQAFDRAMPLSVISRYRIMGQGIKSFSANGHLEGRPPQQQVFEGQQQTHLQEMLSSEQTEKAVGAVGN